MLELAGEIADGVLLSLTTPSTLNGMMSAIWAGAEKGGRSGEALEISCVIPCCFDEPRIARRAGRGVVIGYARHPAAARIFAEHGFERQLARVLEALDSGNVDAAHELVVDEMVEQFVLVGDRDDAARRVAPYLAAGVDNLILFPVSTAPDWSDSIRRAIDVATYLGTLPDARATLNRKVLT
jgi:alkanesulfonate monooxygenase SsuD/methylene tetrahydromethanopterin reductase-like flavin-dependent oxidoreductase (luciferase family)